MKKKGTKLQVILIVLLELKTEAPSNILYSCILRRDGLKRLPPPLIPPPEAIGPCFTPKRLESSIAPHFQFRVINGGIIHKGFVDLNPSPFFVAIPKC